MLTCCFQIDRIAELIEYAIFAEQNRKF
jgi:hypothetical protein